MDPIEGDSVEKRAERALVEARDKHVANLQARYALRGYTAHVVGHERLLIARWGRSIEKSLEEAEALLERVEGEHATR